MTSMRLLLAVAGLCGLTPLVASAQSACRPADSASVRFTQWVRNIATGTSSHAVGLRAETKIPLTSASQIAYITDNRTCSRVLSPYNAETVMTVTATGAAITPSGSVYVVRAGTVYVVWDPIKSAGSYAVYVTLDSKYKVLWSGIG
jgi:hypothetical protein